MLNDKVKKAVEEYQCPGCVCGSDTECYEKGRESQCGKHVAGTTIWPGVGKIFLGMPTGFCRLGPCDEMKLEIFENFDAGWQYEKDKFNVPVWKHLDEHGNTLVRGISPRINFPFLHVFLGDCMSKINCAEITEADLEGMD